MKKSYAEDTKLKIIKEIINGSTYLQVSRKYGISINSAKKWFKESGYIITGADVEARQKEMRLATIDFREKIFQVDEIGDASTFLQECDEVKLMIIKRIKELVPFAAVTHLKDLATALKAIEDVSPEPGSPSSEKKILSTVIEMIIKNKINGKKST